MLSTHSKAARLATNEDGYSLEGFDVPQVTVEVAASQIIPIAQWQQEEMILRKLRQLSKSRLLQLEDYKFSRPLVIHY